MKLSFSTLACPDWSSRRAIEAARNYGYDGIEWRMVDGSFLDSQFPLSTAARLGDDVRAEGLEVCAVDTGIRLLVAPGPDQEAMLCEARAMLKIASAFKAQHLRVFLGDIPRGVTVPQAASWTSANVAALIDDAEAAEVSLALELHNPFTAPVAGAAIVKSSRFAMEVLSKIPTPAVGVQWDWGNPYLEDEVASETWEAIKSRLLYCHSKDVGPDPNGSLTYVPMGEGVIPIPEILTWLRAAGFAGWLSFEWEKKWHPELAEPDLALPQFVEYMRAQL